MLRALSKSKPKRQGKDGTFYSWEAVPTSNSVVNGHVRGRADKKTVGTVSQHILFL